MWKRNEGEERKSQEGRKKRVWEFESGAFFLLLWPLLSSPLSKRGEYGPLRLSTSSIFPELGKKKGRKETKVGEFSHCFPSSSQFAHRGCFQKCKGGGGRRDESSICARRCRKWKGKRRSKAGSLLLPFPPFGAAAAACITRRGEEREDFFLYCAFVRPPSDAT